MTTVHVRQPSEPAQVGALDVVWSPAGRVQALVDDLASGATVTASEAVRDLLTFAVCAFAADKAVLRGDSPDRWTRQIELHVPLLESGAWPVAASEHLLHRLTGDDWTVIPRAAATPLVSWGAVQLAAPLAQPAEVALISGGLDSLSYLAEVVQQQRHVDFVAHFDPNARKSLQRDLFTNVTGGSQLTRLRQFRVQLAGSDPLNRLAKEDTTRARALLFVSGAIAAASMVGAASVSIPENGFVSINVPLGPNRIGSLSTRTTHPLTVKLFQELLSDLGIPMTLGTPYEYLTKGEVVANGRVAGLTDDAISASVSCAHPLQSRWQKGDFGNCGYCYACLIRRAGLEAAGGDPTTYRSDPRQAMRASSTDFRSVVTALGRPLRGGAVVAAGPVPSSYDVHQAFAMLQRGYGELRAMIQSGLSPDVRARIGW